MLDDVYQAALVAICHHLDEAGAEYSVDEGDVILGDHRLGLSISFEGFVEQGKHILAPVDIQIHLDGDTGDRFRVGTLGVGPDRQTALGEAISEWHLLAVAPLLAALGAAVETRRGPAQPQSLAGWDLYAGRAGIRGRVPAELRAGGPFFQALLARLRDVVGAWPEPPRRTLRTIFFMATREPAACEVQAAVDGLVDEELARLISELPWPQGPETYLYKQLLVLAAGRDE